MARNAFYDALLGGLRWSDIPDKTGTDGQFLHSDGDGATPPDWAAAEGGAGGDVYVRAYWFAAVAAGTTGTLAAPTGGALVFDAWPEGVDALATTLDAGGMPAWQTPLTAGGVPVTVALVAGGDWTLSGTPSAYPVGIVFCYRTKVADLDDTKTLAETQLEPRTGAIAALDTVKRTLTFAFSGNGAAIPAGLQAAIPRLPFGFTPTAWHIVCSAAAEGAAASAASIAFDILVNDWSTSALPTSSVGGTLPSISTAVGATAAASFTDAAWAAGQSVLVKTTGTPTAWWAVLVIEGTSVV